MVEAQLGELGMAEAQFEVQFEVCDPDDEDALTSQGLDAIEMMVQTNPGQKMQPLRKIASGGETSRIMLALKSILAGSDRISVIVFDEIDANIGGRLGSVIGSKLRNLAHGVTPSETNPNGTDAAKGKRKSTRAQIHPSTVKRQRSAPGAVHHPSPADRRLRRPASAHRQAGRRQRQRPPDAHQRRPPHRR